MTVECIRKGFPSDRFVEVAGQAAVTFLGFLAVQGSFFIR